MDTQEPTLDGQINTEEGWLEGFKLDGATWIEGGQVWVLELQPDHSPSSRRDLEETDEPQNAEIVKLKWSSVQSNQRPETEVAIQEYQRESDGIKSCTPEHLKAKETFVGNGEAFSQSLKLSTHQRPQRKNLLHCDQCWKAFRYPSKLAQHQRVHSGQKAKWTQSLPEADSPSFLNPTPVALQVENTFTNCSELHSQNSKVTANQSGRRRRQCFCDQCGKAFRYPCELARHQFQHSRQKVAKRAWSPSKDGEFTPLATPVKNTSINSSSVLCQNSKVTTNHSSRHKKRIFCDQCGKAFQYPSHLIRHQGVHLKPKAAKWSQYQLKVDSHSILESTLLALQTENPFKKSGKAFHQKFKAVTGRNTGPRKWHFCDHCGKAFWYLSELAQHQRVHTRQKAPKWAQSPSEEDKTSLLELTPLATQLKNTFTSCNKVLSQNSTVITNQRSCRRKKRFCGQCGDAFCYPDLTQHQHVHPREKAAKLGQSQSEVDSPGLLESTLLAIKENTFTKSSKAFCQNSKAVTGQNTRLRKQHFCSQCGKGCQRPSELARHQRAHSRQKAAKQAQSLSEAGHHSPSDLNLLITLVENMSINSSKVFSQNSKVTTNQRGHHRRQCFCNHCGKAFQYPSDLDRHRGVHSRQKRTLSQSGAGSPTSVESPFTNSSKVLHSNSKVPTDQRSYHRRQCFCDQCGKAFRYPSGLARHQGICSKQKRTLSQSGAASPASLEPAPVEPQVESTFTDSSKVLHASSEAMIDQSSRCVKLRLCDQCGKTFRYPSDLARHQLVHSRRKAVVPLPEALQRENAPANLSEAVRPSSTRNSNRNTHTKKPYLCDQCGEGFWWRSGLTQHQYTHYEERPYACYLCGQQFKRCVQLEKHKKRHEDSQEGEKERKVFQNTNSASGTGECVPGELLQDLSPERTEELCEPFVRPEACECDACDAEAKGTSQVQPLNSIWEIGISGHPYLVPLPPACERESCETDGEDCSSAQPTEPSILQDEVASPIPVSSAGSCETITTMPTAPAASAEARGLIASVPKEKTSTASIAIDPAAQMSQIGDADPEWLQEQASLPMQGAKPYSCLICSKRFRLVLYLKRHLDIHRPGKPYSCTHCGKKFGRDAYLSKHFHTMHSKVGSRLPRMQCPPQTAVADPEWFPSLNRPRWLQKQASSSAQGAMAHSCPICSKRFRLPKYLKRHLNVHRPGKPYSCTLCRMKFGRNSYLSKHLRNMHSEVDSHVPREQRSPQTDNADPEWLPSSSRPGQLQKQTRSSTQGAMAHSCPICSKCFRSAEHLKRHLNVHQPGKPYSCTLCGKKFGQDSYLSKHLRKMHSEVGSHLPRKQRLPQTDDADPEWFPSLNRPGQLQKQTHLSAQGAMAHSCPICSKCFRLPEHLRRHLNVHRPGKPYSCTVCGKKFGRDSYLSKHLRNMHSKVASRLLRKQRLPQSDDTDPEWLP